MSRQGIKILLFLAGAVLIVSAVALAARPKSINISSDSFLPSGQELKAGKYQVDINEGSKQVTFKMGAKVVATVGCQIVESKKINESSAVGFGVKDNKQQVQELRFSGEHRAIVLTQGGS